MTDAFEALRAPTSPIAPSRRFTGELRARLVDSLARTAEPITLDTTQEPTMTSTTTAAASAPPAGTVVRGLTPYLSVRRAAEALAFYAEAFGAVETQRLVGDDGRIGHAELLLGQQRLALADEYPDHDAVGPETRGGPTCAFTLDVDDADAAFERAVRAGATPVREPVDEFYGLRAAVVVDPFGHRWSLHSPLATELSTDEYATRAREGGYELVVPAAGDDAPPEHHQAKHLDRGDLYYFTLPVRDVARAERFFGQVLGWRLADDGRGHVTNIAAPPGAVTDALPDDTGARLWFVVDDIRAAVSTVRELGGTATEPSESPSGWSSDCTDDQGTVFSLSEPSPLYRR